MIRLSKRLEALSRLCLTGGCGADVGCDHGYLSIRLIQEGRFERMLAMDLREGPLAAAREHIAGAGLADRITCRLSDGLREMRTGEADAVICAGMGGMLMQRILLQDMDKVRSMRQLILQPQSELAEFRRWLHEQGFRIADEDMVLEDGKYYPMMRAEAGSGALYEADCPPDLAEAFGGLLLTGRSPVLRQYLAQRMEITEQALEQLQRARKQGSDARREQRNEELLQERDRIQRAISYYDP